MQRNDEKPGRRAPINGATGVVLAFGAAHDLIPMPAGAGLTRSHLPIWDALMRSRSRAEWKDHDLLVAARICLATRDLERMRKTLRRAGFVSIGAGGQIVPHPLAGPAFALAAELRADVRLLGLSARSSNGSSSDYSAAREAERIARLKSPAKPGGRPGLLA